MKATDFTLAWVQKFDFDGHPYKFSKIDVSLNTPVTTSLFDRYSNYTNEQKNKVMIVLSDGLIATNANNNYCGTVLNEGEIVYLSTILNLLLTNVATHYFGWMRNSLTTAIDVKSSTIYARYNTLAGTFYIFDFNDNPV